MSSKKFEVSIRHEPHISIPELHGEINAFAEEALEVWDYSLVGKTHNRHGVA